MYKTYLGKFIYNFQYVLLIVRSHLRLSSLLHRLIMCVVNPQAYTWIHHAATNSTQLPGIQVNKFLAWPFCVLVVLLLLQDRNRWTFQWLSSSLLSSVLSAHQLATILATAQKLGFIAQLLVCNLQHTVQHPEMAKLSGTVGSCRESIMNSGGIVGISDTNFSFFFSLHLHT